MRTELRFELIFLSHDMFLRGMDCLSQRLLCDGVGNTILLRRVVSGQAGFTITMVSLWPPATWGSQLVDYYSWWFLLRVGRRARSKGLLLIQRGVIFSIFLWQESPKFCWLLYYGQKADQEAFMAFQIAFTAGQGAFTAGLLAFTTWFTSMDKPEEDRHAVLHSVQVLVCRKSVSFLPKVFWRDIEKQRDVPWRPNASLNLTYLTKLFQKTWWTSQKCYLRELEGRRGTFERSFVLPVVGYSVRSRFFCTFVPRTKWLAVCSVGSWSAILSWEIGHDKINDISLHLRGKTPQDSGVVEMPRRWNDASVPHTKCFEAWWSVHTNVSGDGFVAGLESEQRMKGIPWSPDGVSDQSISETMSLWQVWDKIKKDTIEAWPGLQGQGMEELGWFYRILSMSRTERRCRSAKSTSCKKICQNWTPQRKPEGLLKFRTARVQFCKNLGLQRYKTSNRLNDAFALDYLHLVPEEKPESPKWCSAVAWAIHLQLSWGRISSLPPSWKVPIFFQDLADSKIRESSMARVDSTK